MQLDLAISLGPNCQTAFQLRRITGNEHAFPFDWWVTPLHSVARIVEAEFRLEIEPGNLVPTPDGRAILNRAFDVLHFHDFPRRGGVVTVPDAAAMAKVRATCERRGERFMDEVARARCVGFFLAGLMGRNRYTGIGHPVRASCRRLLRVLEARFPSTDVRLLVANGERLRGLDPRIVPFRCPDHGDRWQGEARHFGGSSRGWDEGFAELGCSVRREPTEELPPPRRPAPRPARRREPDGEPASLVALGRALCRGGGIGSALPLAIEAAARAPEDYGARTLLAQVLEGTGAVDAAAEAWRHAIALGPDRAWPRYRLSRALSRLGRNGDALEQADLAAELAPTSTLYQGHLDRLSARAAA